MNKQKLKIAKRIDSRDHEIMTTFIDTIRLRKKENVNLEIQARRTAELMGLNPDITNAKLANEFADILEMIPSVPKISKELKPFFKIRPIGFWFCS